MRQPFCLFFALSSLVMINISGKAIAHDLVLLSQNSIPKYISQNGKMSGLCGDIYAKLSERLAFQGETVRISQQAMPIKRILKTLEIEESHGFCGAALNAQRKEQFVYIDTPVYEVANMLLANKENPYNPKSFNELRMSGASVGAFYGTNSSRYLKENMKINVNDQFITLSEAADAVANQYVDYFFYHNLSLNHFLKGPQKRLRLVPTRFRTYEHWLILSKNTPEKLIDLVSQELAAMAENGELSAIREKYLGPEPAGPSQSR